MSTSHRTGVTLSVVGAIVVDEPGSLVVLVAVRPLISGMAARISRLEWGLRVGIQVLGVAAYGRIGRENWVLTLIGIKAIMQGSQLSGFPVLVDGAAGLPSSYL